jgi:hypothetical protein
MNLEYLIVLTGLVIVAFVVLRISLRAGKKRNTQNRKEVKMTSAEQDYLDDKSDIDLRDPD